MLNNCFLLNIDLKLKQLFDKIFLFTFITRFYKNEIISYEIKI